MLKTREKIAIDFDGVIHAYSQGWKDGDIYDMPVPGVRDALTSLIQRFHIVIYSARAYDLIQTGYFRLRQVRAMARWLSDHCIPYDEIHVAPGKPHCKVFIDDKGYRFEGDWEKTVVDIEKLSSQGWSTSPPPDAGELYLDALGAAEAMDHKISMKFIAEGLKRAKVKTSVDELTNRMDNLVARVNGCAAAIGRISEGKEPFPIPWGPDGL